MQDDISVGGGGPTDEHLVARARAGDSAAMHLLFQRWVPVIRARARHRLRGRLRRRVSESDVAQEACLTAFRKMPDFEDRGEGSFGRWISKILDWKLREQVRHHVGAAKRDVRLEQSTAGEPRGAHGYASGGTPSVVARRAEDALAIGLATAGLPERYRNVLRLVHESQLPIGEVARLTGRSEGAAGMLYARAIRALGESLGRLYAP